METKPIFRAYAQLSPEGKRRSYIANMRKALKHVELEDSSSKHTPYSGIFNERDNIPYLGRMVQECEWLKLILEALTQTSLDLKRRPVGRADEYIHKRERVCLLQGRIVIFSKAVRKKDTNLNNYSQLDIKYWRKEIDDLINTYAKTSMLKTNALKNHFSVIGSYVFKNIKSGKIESRTHLSHKRTDKVLEIRETVNLEEGIKVSLEMPWWTDCTKVEKDYPITDFPVFKLAQLPEFGI